MKRLKVLTIANMIFFLIHLAMAWLSQIKVFANRDVGEVSDLNPTLFAPAGFTFSIWGVIYLALSMFCIYQLLAAFKSTPDHPANSLTKSIGALFIINSIATALWLYFWVNEMILISLLLIVLQLLTLILIDVRLSNVAGNSTWQNRIFVRIPFRIYFGWICIATIANTSAYLTSIGWSGGLTEINWTIVMIGLAAVLTVLMTSLRKEPFFGLVAIWAFYGILSKRKALEPQLYNEIILTCQVAMALVAVVIILILITRLRQQRLSRA